MTNSIKYNKEHYIQKKCHLKPDENEKLDFALKRENLSLRKFIMEYVEIKIRKDK